MMREQINEMMKQGFNNDKQYEVSVWLNASPEGNGSTICYVNTSGHPVYNVRLEITEASKRYVEIPSLDPATTPTPIEKANQYFAEELRSIANHLRRPGVAFQCDTFDGDRYVRDHTGDVISVGGSAIDGPRLRPHCMWLPEDHR